MSRLERTADQKCWIHENVGGYYRKHGMPIDIYRFDNGIFSKQGMQFYCNKNYHNYINEKYWIRFNKFELHRDGLTRMI